MLVIRGCGVFLPLRLSSGFHGITGPLPHYSMVRLTGLSFSVCQPCRSRGAGRLGGSSCRERLRNDTLKESNVFLTVPLGLCPSPGLPREPGQTAGCFFSNSGVRQTLSGATSRMFSAFSSDPGSMSFARAYGVIPPRLSLGALLMWLIIRLMSYCV